MRLLGIETTGPFCSVALKTESEIYELSGDKKLNHLSGLTPTIKKITEEAGLTLKELDAICVSEGPGSFTGIRIGVSTGRGIAQVLGLPLISVPTIFAFGRDIFKKAKKNSGKEKNENLIIACPVFNARRNQVYAGAYRGNQEIVKAGPYMLEEFIEKLRGELTASQDEALYFAGDGVEAYGEQIKESMPKAHFLDICQSALGVCDMAFYMLSNRNAFEDNLDLNYKNLKPNYMRMPEAERKLKEGKL